MKMLVLCRLPHSPAVVYPIPLNSDSCRALLLHFVLILLLALVGKRSYFGLSVAGYPEGHIDWFKDTPAISEENYRKDMQVPPDTTAVPALVLARSASLCPMPFRRFAVPLLRRCRLKAVIPRRHPAPYACANGPRRVRADAEVSGGSISRRKWTPGRTAS